MKMRTDFFFFIEKAICQNRKEIRVEMRDGKINLVQLKTSLTSLCLLCDLTHFPKEKGSHSAF